MKDAAIGLRVNSLSSAERDKQKSPSSKTNIEIIGNRDGLLRLAEEIRTLANKGGSDYYIHFADDVDEPLMITKDMWLTVTLHSGKW